MNDKIRQNTPRERRAAKGVKTGREAAYVGVFVALLIATQLCFASIPGVEAVTVLFVAFSFSFGVKRSMIAATVFSLLRQLVFGFYPTVLVLYLTYYNMSGVLFGFLGHKLQPNVKNLVFLTGLACVCTVFFTLFDNLLTPLWYGYSERVIKMYFYASLSFMLPQAICTAVTVGCLFLPLVKIFRIVQK